MSFIHVLLIATLAGFALACSKDEPSDERTSGALRDGGSGRGGSSSAASGGSSGADNRDGGTDFGNAPPGTVIERDAATGMRVDAAMMDCDDKALKLTLRDFKEEHPDFEDFYPDTWDALTDRNGIVQENLGADKKPIYAPVAGTEVTSGPQAFAEWYRDISGVNERIEAEITFQETMPGVFVYEDDEFFPLDGMGFGNGPDPEHNFLFTTEAHTLFTYEGGEEFTFRGDDDLWIFVNGKLVIDLGGVHRELEESIDFDAQATELGIEVGKTYPMDIFHAERHTSESHFRIETTIDLSCVQNIPVM